MQTDSANHFDLTAKQPEDHLELLPLLLLQLELCADQLADSEENPHELLHLQLVFEGL